MGVALWRAIDSDGLSDEGTPIEEETPSDPPTREDGAALMDEDETAVGVTVSLGRDVLPVAKDGLDSNASSEEEPVEGGKEKDCDGGGGGCNADDELS